MSRPARIKTEKDAYNDGLSVGSDGSGMSGGAWPSQADFDKPDSFVRAWTHGFSDGRSDRLGQFRPAWSIDNPKRKTVKKRKFRRVAKRRAAGRTMTVTTSSRVVKTTRMNPRGLDISPYRRKFKIGRYQWSVDHSTSSKNTRAIMRKLFPDWSKEDHVERLIKLSRMIHVASAVWGRIADRAHAEAFPGKRRGMLDYKISGVGRDEYPERLKGRLRIAARQEGTIVSAIHAHAMMAGKAALRRAKIDPHTISHYRSGLTNPRPSKTHIEFIIQGNYGQGWEDENTEMTRDDAKRSLREYRENGPGSYRLIRRRVKNDATNPRRPATRARVVRYYRYGTHKDAVTADSPTKFMSLADAMRTAKNYTAVSNRYAHVMTRGGRIVKSFKSRMQAGNNPNDSRTAETQRMPAVIRVSIPAGGKDPRSAETRRLKVITSAHRKNPVRNLVVPRTMWKSLSKRDKRTRAGHRYVRCKTRRARRAFWLPCTIR